MFPWFAMLRQVVVVGQVEQVTRAESGAYFGTRPYGSRLGAWASAQSTVIASRDVLKARYAELAAAFPDTGSPDDVPLPDFWGGLRVRPVSSGVLAGQGRPGCTTGSGSAAARASRRRSTPPMPGRWSA